MNKTLLVDGMGCIYDDNFKLNKELLGILNSFSINKILVVNGFKDKGKNAIKGNGFEVFSLEEDKIKKDNSEYFRILLSRFNLKPEEVIYFDRAEKNVKVASDLGIKSTVYSSNGQIKMFIEENLS